MWGKRRMAWTNRGRLKPPHETEYHEGYSSRICRCVHEMLPKLSGPLGALLPMRFNDRPTQRVMKPRIRRRLSEAYAGTALPRQSFGERYGTVGGN